jgi:hypothetical protein
MMWWPRPHELFKLFVHNKSFLSRRDILSANRSLEIAGKLFMRIGEARHGETGDHLRLRRHVA